MHRCARTLLLAAILLGAQPALGAEIFGRVVGVSDGDTITVLDDSKTQHKVRFAGIDAPEKSQVFGECSKQNLSVLVFQKRVEARCHKKDRYGREVCAVYVNLRDVGLEQILQGMAWHYKEYQHEQSTQGLLGGIFPDRPLQPELGLGERRREADRGGELTSSVHSAAPREAY